MDPIRAILDLLMQVRRRPTDGARGSNACDGVINIRSHYRQVLALAFVLVAMLATAGPASAQDCNKSVTVDQYGDRIEQLSSTTCDPGDPPAGALPFTGLDVGLMVGAAGVLVAGGVFLRRRSRAEAGV